MDTNVIYYSQMKLRGGEHKGWRGGAGGVGSGGWVGGVGVGVGVSWVCGCGCGVCADLQCRPEGGRVNHSNSKWPITLRPHI